MLPIAADGVEPTVSEYVGRCIDMRPDDTLISADSGVPVLAALWRPGPLTLCPRMFRGVFRLGNTPGLPTVTPCEVKTRALVQIFP
jgi:hypothetical protein